MDKLQWFKFTPTDWVMGKIQKCPEVTQSRFLRLCCLYWNKECNLSYEDAEIEIDAEHLEILIKKKVVKLVSEQIIIEFLSDQLSDIESSSTAKSQGGLIGNLKRWHKPQYELYLKGELTLDAAFEIANQSHTDNIPIGEQSQNIADKIRVDKIRKDNVVVNWEALIDQFNQLTGKQTRTVPEKAKKQLVARLNEGYSKDDIVEAIENCFADPYHKETNHKHLTLEFITRADKLDKYLSVKHKTIGVTQDRTGML